MSEKEGNRFFNAVTESILPAISLNSSLKVLELREYLQAEMKTSIDSIAEIFEEVELFKSNIEAKEKAD